MDDFMSADFKVLWIGCELDVNGIIRVADLIWRGEESVFAVFLLLILVNYN